MIKCNNACPIGQFEGCCFSCHNMESCDQSCDMQPTSCGESTMDDTEQLQIFQQGQVAVIQQIADLAIAKKNLEEQEKDLKEKLREAMEKCNIKKFESDILTITYVAETTATTVDSKALKEKHPDIYAKCSKVSPKSAYVKVAVK